MAAAAAAVIERRDHLDCRAVTELDLGGIHLPQLVRSRAHETAERRGWLCRPSAHQAVADKDLMHRRTGRHPGNTAASQLDSDPPRSPARMGPTHVHDLALQQRWDPARGPSWPTRAILQPDIALDATASTPHVERLARHLPQLARLGDGEITMVNRVEHLTSLLPHADSFEPHPSASRNVSYMSGMSPRRDVNNVPGTHKSPGTSAVTQSSGQVAAESSRRRRSRSRALMTANWRTCSRSDPRRMVLACEPVGRAMPMHTVPTGMPSCSSGPATPVRLSPTSAPSSRCTPSAISIAAGSLTTGPDDTSSSSYFTSLA